MSRTSPPLPRHKVLDRDDIRQLQLTHFSGPFDLLLALVRRRELDILDIPIAAITADYLHCLEVMREELSIEISGDFLAMAATLTFLKSKRLLPEVADPDEDDPDADPELITSEEELLARLAEFERYQQAAEQLWDRDVLGRDTFTRDAPPPTGFEQDTEVAPVKLLGLARAFFDLVKDRTPRYLREKLRVGMSLADGIGRILARVGIRARWRFVELLEHEEDRGDAVALFLSILELARWKIVRVHQDVLAGEPLSIQRGREPDPEELARILAASEHR